MVSLTACMHAWRLIMDSVKQQGNSSSPMLRKRDATCNSLAGSSAASAMYHVFMESAYHA